MSVVLSTLCKGVKEEKKNTLVKAMYSCFIVLLIVAQTRVYTNTVQIIFCQIFCCLYTVKEQVGNIPH